MGASFSYQQRYGGSSFPPLLMAGLLGGNETPHKHLSWAFYALGYCIALERHQEL
jgi:hypothetical protein